MPTARASHVRSHPLTPRGSGQRDGRAGDGHREGGPMDEAGQDDGDDHRNQRRDDAQHLAGGGGAGSAGLVVLTSHG